MAALGTLVAGDSSTGGESRLRRSLWRVHSSKSGWLENLFGKCFRWRVILTVAVAPERLCDDCNTTGVTVVG